MAISTEHIGHREPVPEEVLQVMCELFQVDRALVDNPQGNIDILIGMDACGLLLKDQDVPRTPFMRDLNISKSALSDFL